MNFTQAEPDPGCPTGKAVLEHRSLVTSKLGDHGLREKPGQTDRFVKMSGEGGS